MGSAADWHAFLDEFRSFGGRAENVMRRKSSRGMGLFPIDASKPVDLHIPKELLVAIDDIEVIDGNIKVKDNQNLPKNYIDWFERYQRIYSWGVEAEGRQNILDFEKGLKSLPDNIQNILKRIQVYNAEKRFPEENIDNEILQRFIRTRCVNHRGKYFMMPIIDLVNHNALAKPYDMSDEGISIQGMHDGEIVVKYNISDPLRRFFIYGFNTVEPMGFSVFCRIEHENKTVIVQGGVNERPMRPCKITFRDNRLVVEQPLLGSIRSPRLPRTLFLQACQDLEGIDGQELFEQIQQSNTIIFITLIRELQKIEGDIASQLRDACLEQLAAQSHYFGQRNDLGIEAKS